MNCLYQLCFAVLPGNQIQEWVTVAANLPHSANRILSINGFQVRQPCRAEAVGDWSVMPYTGNGSSRIDYTKRQNTLIVQHGSDVQHLLLGQRIDPDHEKSITGDHVVRPPYPAEMSDNGSGEFPVPDLLDLAVTYDANLPVGMVIDNAMNDSD